MSSVVLKALSSWNHTMRFLLPLTFVEHQLAVLVQLPLLECCKDGETHILSFSSKFLPGLHNIRALVTVNEHPLLHVENIKPKMMEPLSHRLHRHSARKAWLKGGIGQHVVVHPVAESYGCEVGSSFWSSILSYVDSCSLTDLLI